jgi:hypothetical protein
MTKDLIWISLPAIGFCLGLLPKPKIVFSIVAVCAVGATAYILSRYEDEQQGVISGVVVIGGPLAAGFVAVGALVGSWGRKYAANGKAQYTLLISAIVFGSAAFLVFNSGRHEQAMIDQEHLALEFVKQNKEVMQEVGGHGKVSLVSSNIEHNTTVSYNISVRGAKRVDVTVDVSRQAGKPAFTLACITEIGRRDPYKHPCNR